MALNCAPSEIPTDLGCLPTEPGPFAAKFYGVGLSMVGGLSLLFILYGAYLILTSQGDFQKLQNGKSYIFYAVLGLILVVFGVFFLKVIAVDILKIPGFN